MFVSVSCLGGTLPGGRSQGGTSYMSPSSSSCSIKIKAIVEIITKQREWSALCFLSYSQIHHVATQTWRCCLKLVQIDRDTWTKERDEPHLIFIYIKSDLTCPGGSWRPTAPETTQDAVNITLLHKKLWSSVFILTGSLVFQKSSENSRQIKDERRKSQKMPDIWVWCCQTKRLVNNYYLLWVIHQLHLSAWVTDCSLSKVTQRWEQTTQYHKK